VKALRRGFEVAKAVASARVYATALGAYKLWINGRTVGNEFLAPGWDGFRERVVYQTYDVTADVKNGKNASRRCLRRAGIRLRCNGFGRDTTMANSTGVGAQLRIEYPDGSADTIVTDEQWKADIHRF